jgi:hypothetical protein
LPSDIYTIAGESRQDDGDDEISDEESEGQASTLEDPDEDEDEPPVDFVYNTMGFWRMLRKRSEVGGRKCNLNAFLKQWIELPRCKPLLIAALNQKAVKMALKNEGYVFAQLYGVFCTWLGLGSETNCGNECRGQSC